MVEDKVFYDQICIHCDRMNWDHSPLCPEYMPPWERRPEPKWTNRQWDKVQQIEAEIIGWREKHAKALLEIDKLKAKVDRSSKKYNKYIS